jgi:hypothetical protein
VPPVLPRAVLRMAAATCRGCGATRAELKLEVSTYAPKAEPSQRFCMQLIAAGQKGSGLTPGMVPFEVESTAIRQHGFSANKDDDGVRLVVSTSAHSSRDGSVVNASGHNGVSTRHSSLSGYGGHGSFASAKCGAQLLTATALKAPGGPLLALVSNERSGQTSDW